jgi:hypothetical protein
MQFFDFPSPTDLGFYSTAPMQELRDRRLEINVVYYVMKKLKHVPTSVNYLRFTRQQLKDKFKTGEALDVIYDFTEMFKQSGWDLHFEFFDGKPSEVVITAQNYDEEYYSVNKIQSTKFNE